MSARPPPAAAASAAALERRRNMAFDMAMLVKQPVDSATLSVPPPPDLAAVSRKDIVRKGGLRRKNRYMFVLPGKLNAMATGRVGYVTGLDSTTPRLYLEFPLGRLRLTGSIVHPEHQLVTMQIRSRAATVELADCFTSFVIFSLAEWVGTAEDNPDELVLPLPAEVFDAAAGAELAAADEPKAKSTPTSRRTPKHKLQHRGDDDILDEDSPMDASGSDSEGTGSSRSSRSGDDDEQDDDEDASDGSAPAVSSTPASRRTPRRAAANVAAGKYAEAAASSGDDEAKSQDGSASPVLAAPPPTTKRQLPTPVQPKAPKASAFSALTNWLQPPPAAVPVLGGGAKVTKMPKAPKAPKAPKPVETIDLLDSPAKHTPRRQPKSSGGQRKRKPVASSSEDEVVLASDNEESGDDDTAPLASSQSSRPVRSARLKAKPIVDEPSDEDEEQVDDDSDAPKPKRMSAPKSASKRQRTAKRRAAHEDGDDDDGVELDSDYDE